jgi:hypothetical protein
MLKKLCLLPAVYLCAWYSSKKNSIYFAKQQ